MIENIEPYNEMKIFRHTEKIKDLEKNVISGPIFVRAKPTNVCVHNCFYCNYRSGHDKQQKIRFNPKDYLDWNIFEKSIIDFHDMGGKSITFSGGGEPLTYYKIYDAIRLSKDLNLDIAMITNGQELNGKKADILGDANWIRISIDTLNKEMFHKVRQIREEKFIELENNIKNFISLKRTTCEVGINCVVHEYNANHIYDMAEYAKKLGVNHIKFAALINQDTDEYHKYLKSKVIQQINKATEELTENNFRVYDKYSNHFDLSAKMYRTYEKCPIMQIGTIIGADGGIYLCHDKAYDELGILGNLKNNSLKEIWFSEDTRKFFETFNAKEKCKHHCMYDSRNILINDYLNVDSKNVNFI